MWAWWAACLLTPRAWAIAGQEVAAAARASTCSVICAFRRWAAVVSSVSRASPSIRLWLVASSGGGLDNTCCREYCPAGRCGCFRPGWDRCCRARLNRYEAGTSQPTLDVLRALAVALSVSTDALVFSENERGPTDPTLAIHLEALNRLDDDERATILNLIESVLLRHEARRLARTS